MQLAERAGLSPSYISALERDEPNARDGSPRRPRVDKLEKIAKVLNVPADEVMEAAGYLPRSMQMPPRNLAELLAALERLGISQLDRFEGFPADMSEQDYSDLLRDLELTIEIHLRRRLAE